MKFYTLTILLLLLFPFASPEAIEFLAFSPKGDSGQALLRNKPRVANIIFKSTDGGQTWQDMSEGLPENEQADGFVEKGSELYIRVGNGIYHSKPNSTEPIWKKEIFPGKHSGIAPSKSGIFAYNYSDGRFLQKINGMSIWSPMYMNFQEKQVSTVFETALGTVFISSGNGLFKSTNSGKTWKQVHTGSWVNKMVETNGVLLAASQKGILRSKDNGENWNWVINEGGVGIAVEYIKGGFAAITYNTESKTRRVRISYDGGTIWQPIDAGLPASPLISSIVEVGEYFFCGHPSGIYRSADKGKTWKLLLPSMENKVFNLFVSGKVIYAIPREGGC